MKLPNRFRAVRLSVVSILFGSAIGFAQSAVEPVEKLEGYSKLAFPSERFDLVLNILTMDEKEPELSPAQRHELQKLLADNAFFGAMEFSEKCGANCSDMTPIHRFVDRMAVFAPTPETLDEQGCDGGFDSYPMLLLVDAGVYCLEENYADCHIKLEAARGYSSYNFATGARQSFLANLITVEKQLANFDPMAPGSYVTNKGPLQSWIGRVERREGSGVHVLITYDREGGEAKTDMPTYFSSDEVKPLGAISVDALLKGWRG